MRPPEFTGGNRETLGGTHDLAVLGFNEAAGIHRRKPDDQLDELVAGVVASMRPPEFTGGNSGARRVLQVRVLRCFNEAAGIHRRKLSHFLTHAEVINRLQ